MTAACWSRFSAFAVAFAVLGCIAGAASGQDKKPVALTAEAEKAILAEFPDARIGDVQERREGRFRLFDVELAVGKQETDVTVSAEGVILDIEIEIPQADVPKAAVDAIGGLAVGARVMSYGKLTTLAQVERRRIVKLDQPVISYTACLARDVADVEVTPAGEVLQKPEWKKPAPAPVPAPAPAPETKPVETK